MNPFPEHQEGAKSLRLNVKEIATGGGIYPYVRIFLLDGGKISPVICLIVVVHVGGDEKDIGGNPCSILKSDQKEEVSENHR